MHQNSNTVVLIKPETTIARVQKITNNNNQQEQSQQQLQTQQQQQQPQSQQTVSIKLSTTENGNSNEKKIKTRVSACRSNINNNSLIHFLYHFICSVTIIVVFSII